MEEEYSYSRLLTLILRHKPEKIGIHLDKGGWALCDDLLIKMKESGRELSFDELKEIVDTNDKERFEFSSDFTKIRASQGHSIGVDLGLKPIVPPFILYHGTSSDKIESIFKIGLEKKNRDHLHLSIDTQTAISVGKRHVSLGNSLVILEIHARAMFTDGYKFYVSKNGVWLTNNVPVKYITIWKK